VPGSAVAPQVGDIGAGNHFIEVDEVTEIYDEEAARAMGLFPEPGSCPNSLWIARFRSPGLHRLCRRVPSRRSRNIYQLPDRELVCAPFNSPEGQSYFAAMACAANYAFANRQVLLAHIRRSFEQVLAGRGERLDVFQVYDIAHTWPRSRRMI